jgi:transposase
VLARPQARLRGERGAPELPGFLTKRSDVLSPCMLRIIEDLAGDWRRLDERIEGLSDEIAALSAQDAACKRLMTVRGIGPIISSAMGSGDVFAQRLRVFPREQRFLSVPPIAVGVNNA